MIHVYCVSIKYRGEAGIKEGQGLYQMNCVGFFFFNLFGSQDNIQ